MSTPSSKRRTVDRGRFSRMASAPGVDTRTWISLARVDDDDDAIRWGAPDSEDGAVGWLVDVHFIGGALEGEGPVVCRVASQVGAEGQTASDPVPRGCLVVVALPEGEPDVMPVIVGFVSSVGCAVPSEVNGTPIDEEYALATSIRVLAGDVDEQVGGDIRVRAEGDHRVLADGTLMLGVQDPNQAFVRGNAQKDAIGDFLTSFTTWIGLVRAGVIAGGGTLDNTAMTQAVSALRTGLTNALSSKIKGE
jgi:hypothetical protein